MVEPGIFWGIFYRLGLRLGLTREYSSARLTARLNRLYMARVDGTRLQPLGASDAHGQTVQNLQVARVGYLGLGSS